MSTQHPFIFTPDAWLGEGKIQLNMVEEELSFFTRWSITHPDGLGRIECMQEIQVKGLAEVMINQFALFDLTPSGFSIELENQSLGKILKLGLRGLSSMRSNLMEATSCEQNMLLPTSFAHSFRGRFGRKRSLRFPIKL
jgi:hypothetical protein